MSILSILNAIHLRPVCGFSPEMHSYTTMPPQFHSAGHVKTLPRITSARPDSTDVDFVVATALCFECWPQNSRVRQHGFHYSLRVTELVQVYPGL